MTACGTAGHDPLGRPLGGARRLPPGGPRLRRRDPGAGGASADGPRSSDRSPTRRRSSSRSRRSWPRPPATAPGRRGRCRRRRRCWPPAAPWAMPWASTVRAPRRTLRSDREAHPSDPLGDLARASGFHVRPVTLPDGLVAHAAASRCWAPARTRRRPDTRRPAARRRGRRPGRRPAYDAPDARRPDGTRSIDELAGSIAPDGLALLPAAARSSRSGSVDLFRFCRGLPGLARELGLVLVDGVRRRAARPGDPDRLGHPRRPGHPRGRPAISRAGPRGSR